MDFPTTLHTAKIPRIDESWHTLDEQKTIELLDSDLARGLSTEEAFQRQRYFGTNELKETGKRSTLSILWDQFTNIMLVMLIAVAIVSAVLNLRQGSFPKEAIAVLMRVPLRLS